MFPIRPISTVGARLIIYIVLFSSGITLMTTCIQLYLDYERDLDHVESQIGLIEISYLDGVANSLWTFDDQQLEILLDGIVKFRDVVYASVSANGELVLQAGELKENNVVKKDHELSRIHDGQIVPLGVLRVVADLQGVYDRVIDRLWVILVSNGIKTFSVAVFVFVVFQYVVTRHLKRIASFARDLAHERLDEPLVMAGVPNQGARDDEIGQLVSAINEMRGNLSSSYRALAESEGRFRATFEQAAVGIAHLSTDGHWLRVNRRFCEIVGYSHAELLELTFQDIAHRDDLDDNLGHLGQALVGEVPAYSMEKRYIRKDGSIVWINLTVALVRDASGEPDYFISVIEDIDRRKAIEKEIHELNRELETRVERRTAELRAAQGELVKKERLATLGQLTATVSHELRNPLGTMRTSTHLVRKLASGEDARLANAAERLDRGITRCDRIIDELLDFTRIGDPELQVFPLDDWLARQLDELEVPEGVTLRRNYGLPGTEVAIDSGRMRRAVVNLFENACQAVLERAAGGGLVTVSTRRRDGLAEITIADNGPGIAPEVLPRIFEPLFSTKSFGVGLGMAVVKQVLEQHGGAVEVDSAVGHGAEARLSIPIAMAGSGTADQAAISSDQRRTS